MRDLPVYQVEKKLVESVHAREAARILLKAPTGSGKSTAVPQMILDEVKGLIVVVQPRRIAARMLARRVAQMRGGKVGGEVGHVVRFDRQMGTETRIVYVTDGVLESWLERGQMDGVGAVVFDEFHERRLASDLSLALCLQLQEQKMKDLKVVVMSATLEMGGLYEYLGEQCVQIEASGRSYPVEVAYQALPVQSRGAKREVALWERCAAAAKDVLAQQSEGHLLIFLPGVYEIRRTVELLESASWTRGFLVCPLYSALSPEAQDLAVSGAAEKRRIIVSTNVAETSLTIDGVRGVIDTGLARISQYDPLRAIDTLMVKKISRAAAEQRAGRAGRTGPGYCLRLWSEADHARRLTYELPEVHRADLTETMLQLKKRGCLDVRKFPWLECPRDPLIEHAEELLGELAAIDSNGELTEMGERMGVLQMHPRYSRLLLAAQEEGCLAEAVFIAASVQGEGVFLRKGEGRKHFSYDDDLTDFASEWRGFQSAQQMQFDPRRCSAIGVLARGAREVEKSVVQVKKLCERQGMPLEKVDFDSNAEAVSRAMLAAFSDQLAVRVGKGNFACRLVGGRKGVLDELSVVKKAEVFIATELTEVGAKEVKLYLNRCVQVRVEEIQKMFPESFSDGESAYYDETIRRVVNRKETRFRDLVLASKDSGTPDAAMAAQLLAERVANGELKLKKWDQVVEQWIARLLCLREWMPELELPGFDEEDRAIAFEQICEGAFGYKDIKDREVMPALASWLSAGQKAALDHYAPTRIKLENGREVKVKYEIGKQPTIALQVQRLFGVRETPTIAEGKVKLLVQVCAPNQRPWQMTQDLSNFWESGFEQMRKDLAGRYPKHKWELDR
ncbi:ATP-dependent helicase HrpB [Rubritalea spongiae]|uniref:ATP-dependent helicase HrpB n=1 Tax=Rubritalea spongiae TaxID=430797 RepID=A0ABW5E5R6_9BACT